MYNLIYRLKYAMSKIITITKRGKNKSMNTIMKKIGVQVHARCEYLEMIFYSFFFFRLLKNLKVKVRIQ